jgi:hypothetical protein
LDGRKAAVDGRADTGIVGCLPFLSQVGEFSELTAERDGKNANEGDDRRNKEQVHGKLLEIGRMDRSGMVVLLPVQ